MSTPDKRPETTFPGQCSQVTAKAFQIRFRFDVRGLFSRRQVETLFGTGQQFLLEFSVVHSAPEEESAEEVSRFTGNRRQQMQG